MAAQNQIRYKIGFDVDKNGLNSLKTSLQDIQKMKFSDLMKLNQTDVQTARQMLQTIQKDAQAVQSALEKSFNPKLNTVNIQTFNKQLSNSNLTINKLYQDFSKAGSTGQAAFRKLTTQMLNVNTVMKQSHATLDKLSETLTNGIKWGLSSTLINGFTRSIQQAWGYTKSLDTSLNNIRVVTGKSSEQMAKFAIQANKAAQQLGRTTTDYTNAALIYAQQGLSDKEIQERAKITLKAANVTGQSTSEVSQQLTAVWNGYKVTAQQAELYIDRLAAVAATSASNLQELSTGMSKVAAAAATLGVGEDQLAAQLSTIISVTRQAPESVGTALKTVYARITDIKAGIDEDGVTLGKYSEKLAGLGINVLDAAGNLRNMGEVIEQVGGKWEYFSREQQVYIAQTMAGQRQYSNLMALFENFDMYTKELEIARNAEGTLEKQQGIAMDSINKHLNQLKASVEEVYNSLFVDNIGGINNFIDILSDVTSGFSSLIDSIGGGGGALMMLFSGIGTLLSNSIAKGLQTTVNNMQLAKQQAADLQAHMQATDALIKSGVGTQFDKTSFGERRDILNMVGVLPSKQIEELQNALNGLGEAQSNLDIAKDKWSLLARTFDQSTPGIEKLKQEYGSLNDALQSPDGADTMKQALESLKNKYSDIIPKQKEAQEAYKSFVEEVKNGGEDAGKSFETFNTKVSSMITSLKTTVAVDGKTLFDTLPQNAKNAINNCEQAFNQGLDTTNMQASVNGLQSAFNSMSSSVTREMNAINGSIKEIDDGTLQKLWDYIKQLEEQLKQAQKEYNNLKNSATTGVFTKQITATASALVSLGTAVRTLKNIGNIIEDKDLSKGEKAFQIATNLAMVTLTLIPAMTRLNTAFKLIKISAVAQTSAISGAAAAHKIFSKNAETGAYQMTIFNHTLAVSPIFLFITALTALSAAWAIHNQRVQAATKAQEEYSIEAAKAVVEQENKTQQQLDKQEELYKSLEQLNKKYENHQISRSELKTAVQELVSQYDLENTSVKNLTDNYNNLAVAIKGARKGTIQEKKESIDRQVQSNKELFLNDLKKAVGDERKISDTSSLIVKSNGTITLSFNPQIIGTAADYLEGKMENILGTTYANLFGKARSTSVKEGSTNPFSLVNFGEWLNRQLEQGSEETTTIRAHYTKYFDSIEDFINFVDEIASQDNLDQFPQLKSFIQKFTSIIPKSIDTLKESFEQQDVINLESKLYNSSMDLDSNSSIGEYLQRRFWLLITAYFQGGIHDSEQGRKFVDAFLKKYYEDLYIQYNKTAKFSDFLMKSGVFGKGNTPISNALTEWDEYGFRDVENKLVDKDTFFNFINDLPAQALEILEDLDIKNWEDFSNAVGYLSTVDMSQYGPLGDLNQKYEEATSQYELYSSLSDQIRGSKKQTISKKQYESLGQEAQKFFTLMANGTYKMTGDAQDFYKKMNEMSFQGLYDNLSDLRERYINLSSTQVTSFYGSSGKQWQTIDEDQANMFMTGTTEQFGGGVSNELTQKRLGYLKAMGYDTNKLIQLEYAFQMSVEKTGLVSEEVFNEIARVVREQVGYSYDQVDEKMKQLNTAIYQTQLIIAGSAESFKQLKQLYNDGDGAIGIQAYTKAAIDLDKQLDIASLDIDQLQAYTDYLMELAKKQEQAGQGARELSNNLIENEQAAQVIAKNIMKMNDAVDTLADNWQNWLDILSKDQYQSAQQYSLALDGAKDAMAQLLDISKEYISEDFIKDHFDEISQAATGSEQAIDALKAALVDSVVMQVIIQNSLAEGSEQRNNLLEGVSTLQELLKNNPLEVGSVINEQGFTDFYKAAEQFLQNCDLTVDQANAIFDALGFQTHFKEQQEDVEQKVPKITTVTKISGWEKGTIPLFGDIEVPFAYPKFTQSSYTDGYDTYTGKMMVPALSVNDHQAVIDSMVYKGGTAPMHNYSSHNTGGGAPGKSSSSKTSTPKTPKGSTAKAPQPDKSQKDLKKDLQDDRDIYHDINIELEQINRELDRVQKKQDRLYGKQLLDNLNKQTEILEKHKQKLKEKAKIQEWDLQNQQQTLKNLGVTFDEYNNISNYMSILAAKQAQINAKTKEYNGLINLYNASTDKDYKKQISEQAEAINKQLQKQENDYKQLVSKIKNYDDLRKAMEDLTDEIEEETQKQIELNIKKFRMEVQIRLELGQAERNWNQFRRQVLEHTDIMKDSGFDTIFKDATKNLRDMVSYFTVKNSKGSLQKLTEQLNGTLNEIKQIDQTGNSAIYGDNKAQAMQDLKEDLDALMGQLEDIEGLINDIDNAYLDTIDDVSEQFEKQIEDYEYIQQLIEHDIELLSLVYGQKNYNAMDKYYTTLQQKNLKQIESLKMQRDFWKAQRDEALKNGDTNAADKFEQNYKNVISNLNSVIVESAKNVQDKYMNAIDKIFDELDKKVSKGNGLDYLNLDWDLMNKNADEYLDTINSAFAIREAERKYQKALNDVDSVKNQKALRDLMEQQIGFLRNKEKITQYDVERAEKMLQIEQARIALQQAQNAKTSMRLKRDSQGNYTYEFVANQNAIDEAEDNLAKARNDLYNYDKQHFYQNLEDIYAAYKQFESKRLQVMKDMNLSQEERNKQTALLDQRFNTYVNNKLKENLVIRKNLEQSAFMDMEDLYDDFFEKHKNMTEQEKQLLMSELVPAWDSGLQDMADTIAGEGGLIPTCQSAFAQLDKSTATYKDGLKEIEEVGGVSFSNIGQGTDNLIKEFQDLIKNNEKLETKMRGQLESITNLRRQVRGLVQDYKDVYSAAIAAATGTHNFIQSQQINAALGAAAANGTSGSGSGNGTGNNGNSNGTPANSNYDGGSNSGGGSNTPAPSTIQGIAGNIWLYGTWGNGTDRRNNMIAKFGKEQGQAIYKAVQAKFNSGYGYTGGLEHDWNYYRKFSLSSFLSGGYTGTWAGNEGRLGILHQKEMVLNQTDTKNLLNTVSIMRSVVSSLGGTINSKIGELRSGFATIAGDNKDVIEQNVNISAAFPNVNSKKEIEDAFSDLVNLAAQRAMRK